MKSSLTSAPQTAPHSALTPYADLLRANSEVYEELIKPIQAMDLSSKTEAVLQRVVFAAEYASEVHPGRFADGRLENLLLKIGSNLGDRVADDDGFEFPVTPKGSRRRVLHAATFVRGIGGHTRTLYQWILKDRWSCHSLVLVNQNDISIPEWLSAAVRNSGGELVVFPRRSGLCQKAKWLREMAIRGADMVVLHHAAADVVPTLAFAVHECPPVAVLNHAGHQFWLGSSVSDLVINLQTAAAEHTEKRRFVPTNMVLPIPLSDPIGQVSHEDARRALEIPEDQVMLLSIGRDLKYRPCGPYDFVATTGKILDHQPKAHLYVVGESPTGISHHLRCAVHERLHFVGVIENPSLYLAAADVYLESFPFGSLTALLEAAIKGLPVVPAYAPMSPLLVANDDSVQDLLPNPKSEQEYVERVEQLIRRPEQRMELGERLKNRVVADHLGQGWLERLAAVYQETDRLEHHPRPIPASSCIMDDEDIGLSLWHVMANSNFYSSSASWDVVEAVLSHTAFLYKHIGEYAQARRFAWRAVCRNPYRRSSWRLLLITVLGRPGRLIRVALNRI